MTKYDVPQIRRGLEEGLSYREIQQQTGAPKSTISFHAEKRGLSHSPQVYDWEAIQQYHDQGHGARACARKYGFSTTAWTYAVKHGKIQYRDWRIPLESLLVSDRAVSTGHLKGRLRKAGLLSKICEECGIASWNGKPLSLQLDHINGNNKDNRLENIRMLCPNCHSLTPTYCRSRASKKRLMYGL